MLEHITNRRSVFPQFFTGETVSDAHLHAILDAANQAPSHRKTEPWRYRVYRGDGRQDLLELLRKQYENLHGAGSWTEKLQKKFGKKIQQSPVVLLILLRRDPEESVPEWEEIAAVGCSVQNIWTSLAAFKLGGYWSSPGFLCQGYGAVEGEGADTRCLGLFYIGHHQAPKLPRPRGDWRGKVTFVD